MNGRSIEKEWMNQSVEHHMDKHGEFPEATIKDTLDSIPIVVTLLLLANVAAAAAIGRGTYELVKRARARPNPAIRH
jgi:hypothetical protein